MEHRYAGPRAITVLGLNTGTLDLTINGWGHQVLTSLLKLAKLPEIESFKSKMNMIIGK